jgi:leader peptidase (prepilin peptidase)/N-methyltransferase
MTEGVFTALLQVHAFVIGLLLGSFANAAIDRLPHDRSMLPRSACDHCGQRIRPIDLVPVISWLWLRGRCRDCGSWIGAHVPLIELLMGLLTWLLWRRLVPDLSMVDLPHAAAWGVYTLFLLSLLIASYVDVRHRIIPDQTSVLAIPVGVAACWGLSWLGSDGWLALSLRGSVAGVLFAGGFFALVAVAARLARGSDAMGWGDVKLVAAMGAFLGPLPGMMLVMIMATVLGAVFGMLSVLIYRGRGWLPFGPALAVAGVLWVFWGDRIVAAWFPGMGFLLPATRGIVTSFP